MQSREAATTTVPFWFTKLSAAESDAVACAIKAQRLSQGSLTEEFEAKIAAFLQVKHVVATTSGSMALYLAAASLGLGPGDEVILPDRTFMATAHAMMLAGAKVKLVDVQPNSTVIDVARIEAAITTRTKAIVPVHLNGRAADIIAIRKIATTHGLVVIEDTAQAFGSHSSAGYLGTQSDVGCFSLGVTKLITTGQGGFAVTNDTSLADRMRNFRNHGVRDTFSSSYDRFGFNLKYTDIQAAIGLVQLDKIEAKIAAHNQVHKFYTEALAGFSFISVCPIEGPGYIPLWTEALVSDPLRIIRLMEERGIQIRPYLPSLHASRYLGEFDPSEFTNADRFAQHGIFLPSGPDIPEQWLELVAAAFVDIAPLMSYEPLDKYHAS